MIRWNPEISNTVDSWKLAMVLSKKQERILIGTNNDIKQVLSNKGNVKLFFDETRPFGTFLIKFEDDRSECDWRTALSHLKEAQEVTIQEKIFHSRDEDRLDVQMEKQAQTILQKKFDTGDPICQYVATRIWYSYWRIRACRNKERINDYFDRMQNLVRPFYRGEEIRAEDRRILPDDPIFRWPKVSEDSDEYMRIYGQRTEGADRYIVADDSLIPLKLYYTESLKKWSLCIIQCKICGKFFLGKSLHCKYCGESCRKAAQIIRQETRKNNKANKDIEQLCRNEYQYWYNRIRKAKASTVWTEDELYDLESAFIKFKEQKVIMRQKHKAQNITSQQLVDWFVAQRNVVDSIVDKHE